MSRSWSLEQIVTFAGQASRFAAGESVANVGLWTAAGVSDRALWGRYHGSSSEPYDVAVDHVDVRARCSCPSRQRPCKHAIGLLLLWSQGHVAASSEPPAVTRWFRADQPIAPAGDAGNGDAQPADAPSDAPPAPTPPPPEPPGDDGSGDRDTARDQRIARLLAGLVELERWLDDRMRTGLADPALARFDTWDELAARLTDARASALANRIRRLAGKVGASSDWHRRVLAELGVLSLIAAGGRRVPELPDGLADRVATACGWQVRTADVAGGTAETDDWLVAGRSDVREDLIEVRRVWLHGLRSRRWAMVLSFAAYQQTLDESLRVGQVISGDVHRYPGASLRVVVGERTHLAAADVGSRAATEIASSLAAGCADVGAAISAEPWAERLATIVTATVTIDEHGHWVLADEHGTLPIAASERDVTAAIATVLAAGGGRPVAMTVEWTAEGYVPLTVFADGRAYDVGPRADGDFVEAA